MPDRIEEARTACLMLGMAERLGVNPGAALAAGRLDQADIDAMVNRCRSCTRGDDCFLWMVDHAGGAAVPPGYCLNGERLGVLRG